MKRLSILWLMVSVILLVALACAPKATSPTPTMAAQEPAAPVTKAPASSPADAEWAKVVEAAKKEGKVTAYSFNLVGTSGDKVVKFFKDKYGIEVEVVGGVVATLIERIKTDYAAGRYVADYFDASGSSAYALKVAGVTEPYAALLPALKEKDIFQQSPQWDAEGHMVFTLMSGHAIAINTKLVPPGQEPKSWRELIETKWAGKVVFAAPATGSSMIQIYVVKEKLGLDDDYFRQLGKMGKVVVNDPEASAVLARGDASIWIPAFQQVLNPLLIQGAPVKMVIPKEGTTSVGGSTMVKIKNSPHPNATLFFMNWLLTAEGQKVFSEAKVAMPVRKDVPDPSPEAVRMPQGKVPILLDDSIKVAQMQREKTVDKIMGLQ